MLFNKHVLLYLCILLYMGFEKTYGYQINIDSSIQINSTNKAIEQCWQLRQTNSKQAINYCHQALIALKTDNRKCKVLNYTGVVHVHLSNLDSAYIYFKKALNEAFITNNFLEMGFAYNNLGNYYIQNSNYVLATKYIYKAHKIFEEQNNKSGIAYSLVKLTELYVKQEKYEKALDTLRSVLKIRASLNDFKKVAFTQRRMVAVYLKNNEIDSAEMLLKHIFTENLIKNNQVARAYYFDILSEIFYKRKAYKNALNFRLRSIELYRKINNKKGEAVGLYKIAQIYFATDDLTNAENFTLKSIKLAKSIGNKEIKLKNFLLISQVYNANKDYKNAYLFFNEYSQLNDTINSKIRGNNILALEKAYIQEKAESKNRLLKNEIIYNKRIRKNLIAFLVLLSFLAIYLMFVVYTKRIANRRLIASNNAKDRFFSILAHDIKGPMSNIKLIVDLLNADTSKIKINKQEGLQKKLKYSVDNLIELINRLIQWSKATTGRMHFNPVNFSINKEIEAVVALTKVYAIAKKQNLTYNVSKDYLVFADKEMVSTVLRNLVTNAIKFTPENGSIQLFSRKKNNKIEILIKDTGIGMTKQTIYDIIYKDEINSTRGTNNEKGTGIGLSICKELVEITKGKFWIKSKLNKGSKFYFSLPLAN